MKKSLPLFLPVVLFLGLLISLFISACSVGVPNSLSGLLPPSALQVLSDAGVTDIDVYVVANELDAIDASQVYPIVLTAGDYQHATMMLPDCPGTWTLSSAAPPEWWGFNYNVLSSVNFFVCRSAYQCTSLPDTAHIDVATNHGAITVVCNTVP